uniref:Secreted protein n=1 Tax=Ascaris lumbricoides TaxID=6252 RepID=A0A0M3HTE8_ASCLU
MVLESSLFSFYKFLEFLSSFSLLIHFAPRPSFLSSRQNRNSQSQALTHKYHFMQYHNFSLFSYVSKSRRLQF